MSACQASDWRQAQTLKCLGSAVTAQQWPTLDSLVPCSSALPHSCIWHRTISMPAVPARCRALRHCCRPAAYVWNAGREEPHRYRKQCARLRRCCTDRLLATGLPPVRLRTHRKAVQEYKPRRRWRSLTLPVRCPPSSPTEKFDPVAVHGRYRRTSIPTLLFKRYSPLRVSPVASAVLLLAFVR